MELVALYSHIDLVADGKIIQKQLSFQFRMSHTHVRAHALIHPLTPYPPTTRTHKQTKSTTRKNACKRTLYIYRILYIENILICGPCQENIDVCQGCLRGNMQKQNFFFEAEFVALITIAVVAAYGTHFTMDYARFQSGRPNLLN